MTPVLPGATIGFLGGGQLGRMAAMAARTLGYDVHALDPDPACSIRGVADRVVTAKFDDADAAADLARNCQVITLEIEQIAVASIEAAARFAPVRPGAGPIGIIQDRGRQKRWLADHGFPLGDYRDVASADDIASAARDLGPLVVKAVHGGYDGRSQVRVATPHESADAWTMLAQRPSVAEKALDLAAEISVMVARTPSGRMAVYPPALNHHERQVLAWSVIPAPIAPEILNEAQEIAVEIAEQMGIEGLLAVEMFLLGDGRVLVNELAPRPHNSYHETELACVTSQFEQLIRAVCDLPLGDTTVLQPAAIVNLFGDLWGEGTAPPFDLALREPATRLHLYGKKVARAGRKMGHLSAVGSSPEEALQRAQSAFARLTNPVP